MKINRPAIESLCIRRLNEWDTSGINGEVYKDLFKNMTDADFNRWIEGLRSGTNPLFGTIPNFSNVKVEVERIIQLCKSMGYEMYKRIWVTDPVSGTRYLTTNSHLIYEINVCRQIQIQDHKISIPKDNSQVDARTGQPTDDSRSARCSGPELMMVKSRGLDKPILEMIKFRGGDQQSMRLLDDEIIRTGSGAMKGIPGQAERSTKSVETLSSMLTAMLFTNNF